MHVKLCRRIVLSAFIHGSRCEKVRSVGCGSSFVKISMAHPAASDDTHISPAQTLAPREQQVMSPSGAGAAATQQRELPNGVTRPGRPGADDEEYRRVLAADSLAEDTAASRGNLQIGIGSGQSMATTPVEVPAVINSETYQRDVGGAGSASEQATATMVPVQETETTRPLLPHAAIEPVRTATGLGPWWPSPFPSPLSSTSRPTETTSQQAQGRNLAQSGAAAVRWFTHIGKYMRQATMVSQNRPGIEATVVQETRMVPEGETPLFDRTQTRRLQEMTDQAPQLYGPRAQTGAASDTSGSYSKEQLEAEVRRQVELALSSQKGLAEENQRLRLQVERLSTEVSSRGGVGRQPSTLMAMGSTATRHVDERERKGEEAMGSGVPEGNSPGLSGHGREQGGRSKEPYREAEAGGNPRGHSGHEGLPRGDVFGAPGVPEGNPPGLSGHGRGQGGLFEKAQGHQIQQDVTMGAPGSNGVRFEVNDDNVPGGNPPGLSEYGHVPRGRYLGSDNVPGGNPPGLSGHGREQGGRFSVYISMHRVPLGPFSISMHRVPQVQLWLPVRASDVPVAHLHHNERMTRPLKNLVCQMGATRP